MTTTQGEEPPPPTYAAPRGYGGDPPGISFFFLQTGRQDMTDRTRRPSLRAVKDGDGAAPAKKAAAKKAPAKRAPRKVTPVSVTAAARSGDRRQLLVALQNRIAKAIDDPKTTGPAFAALVKQARELAEAIAEIDRPPAEADTSGDWLEAIRNMPAEPWDESYI